MCGRGSLARTCEIGGELLWSRKWSQRNQSIRLNTTYPGYRQESFRNFNPQREFPTHN